MLSVTVVLMLTIEVVISDDTSVAVDLGASVEKTTAVTLDVKVVTLVDV
jgi:hypothetical protein